MSLKSSKSYNYIVDSHCHLDLIRGKGLDIGDVLKEARDNNVKALQTICTKISEFPKILEIANLDSNIYASVGIHPNNVGDEPFAASDEIVKLTKHEKVIGIGETGLDYYYEHSPKELQKKSFLEHIKASQETGLPTIIHTRNAESDTADILESQMKSKTFPALLHCFTSSRKLAFAALDLGLYISISGIVTFKNAKELQEVVRDIPLDRLLVETDAPYLAPVPHRGKINQPAYTRYVVDFIAELKGITPEEAVHATTNNFYKLFRLGEF